MTTTFEVKWPNGSITLERSETSTIEGFAMERWGRTYDEVQALNITIRDNNTYAAVAEPKPEAAPAKRVRKAASLVQSTPITETKVYEDGTSATGPAPLPDQSPGEQATAEQAVAPVVEQPAAEVAAATGAVAKKKSPPKKAAS